MAIPYGYVRVLAANSLNVNIGDVVQVRMRVPLTNATMIISGTQMRNQSFTDTGYYVSLGNGVISVDVLGTQRFDTSVWRAPSRWQSLAGYGPVHSGACVLSMQTAWEQCVLDSDAVVLATDILRAGFIHSGAVAGYMPLTVDPNTRMGFTVMINGTDKSVLAAHGFMLEVPCISPGACAVLGVSTPPITASVVLGWAVYRPSALTTNSSVGPTILSVVKITSVLAELTVCGCIILIVAAIALWLASNQQKRVSRFRKGTVNDNVVPGRYKKLFM